MSAVEARGVSKSFGRRGVLRAVSLAVEPGDMLAIIGPSGVGKTTLLRILAGLLAPDSGTVSVLGEPLVHGNGGIGLRRRMSFVSQKPAAFRETVCDNVAYPLLARGIGDARERANAALDKVGLLDLADAQAVTLSGGELQRMAFARATVYGPEVILLDEFTAHLDPYNVKVLEDAAVAYRKERGATMVMVTHNLFQAKRLAKTTALMLDGNIIEKGETAKIFGSPSDERTGAFVSGEMVF